MKLKLFTVLLLICSIVNVSPTINTFATKSSYDEIEYTEINPYIFDFWLLILQKPFHSLSEKVFIYML